MPPKDKETGLNQKYVPKTLTKADKKKQVASIKKGTIEDRPKVKSAPTKRSSLVVRFEKKYGKKISDLDWISKNIIRRPGIDQIMKKGYGAYKSGSRPNTTARQWALARLAGVIMNSPARKVDKKIWDEYKI